MKISVKYQPNQSQAVEPGSGLLTVHEAQLYLNVFTTQASILMDRQRLELALKRLLQDEGDLFAFKPEVATGAEGSLFSAIVEYCDNDISLKAVARFNNTIIEVCFHDISLKSTLTGDTGRLSALHYVISARHPLVRHPQ